MKKDWGIMPKSLEGEYLYKLVWISMYSWEIYLFKCVCTYIDIDSHRDFIDILFGL